MSEEREEKKATGIKKVDFVGEEYLQGEQRIVKSHPELLPK